MNSHRLKMSGENFFHEYVEPCQHQHHDSEGAYHYNNQNLMSYGNYSGTSISSKDRIMKISSSENKNTFLSQLNPIKLSKINECSQTLYSHKTAMIHTDESRISQWFQNSQDRFRNILHQEAHPIPFPDSTAHIPFNAQNCSRRAKKKTRILFSKEQVRELEACFRRQRYLTAIERDDMALSINLTSNQVKIWFQNRRYKIKKMTEIPPCKSFPKLFDNTSNSTRSAH